VSHPLPSFHSVPFQPSLREEPEAPDLDINIAGLLDSIQQVEQILPVANSMAFSWRPFCGIGVYFVA